MYVSSQCDLNRNAFISPLISGDKQLSQFPPTCILVAGLDPLSDDSFLFSHRYIGYNIFLFDLDLRNAVLKCS